MSEPIQPEILETLKMASRIANGKRTTYSSSIKKPDLEKALVLCFSKHPEVIALIENGLPDSQEEGQGSEGSQAINSDGEQKQEENKRNDENSSGSREH